MIINNSYIPSTSGVKNYEKINTNTDFNLFTTTGVFRLHAPSGFAALVDGGHSPIIDSNECYCQLIVMSNETTTPRLITQIASFPMIKKSNTFNRFFNGSSWSNWTSIGSGSNIEVLSEDPQNPEVGQMWIIL